MEFVPVVCNQLMTCNIDAAGSVDILKEHKTVKGDALRD
jgi:hypothetical protein